MKTIVKTSLNAIAALAVILSAGSFTPRAVAQLEAPGPAYAPDAVLVQFRSGYLPEGIEAAEEAVGGKVMQEYALVADLVYIRLAPGSDVMQAIDTLQALPEVLYAEPDYAITPTDTIPNDPQWSELWGLNDIRAQVAWDMTTGTAAVVAVIDTGTDYNHPDLANNIWTNPGEIAGNGIDDDNNGYVDDLHGYDFYDYDNDPMDTSGHGTHTAGTVCARGNNEQGVAGVVWSCQIMVLRFMGPGGGFSSGALAALQYAVAQGVRVSNNSWGGDGYSASLYHGINNAKSVGHLFVAAAGNGANDNDAVAFYPSSYDLDNIVAVAAIDATDTLATFSNWGATRVDVAAPGVQILSTVPNNSYGRISGTSMAAPHVAGGVAMLYGMHPEWTYGQIKHQILGTARPASSLTGRMVSGGTLDMGAALTTMPAMPAPPTDLTAVPGSLTHINLAWADNAVNETGYVVEQSSSQTGWVEVASLPANTMQFANTGLIAGPYSYRVRAYNAAGTSSYSAVVSVILPQTGTLHVGDLDRATVAANKDWTAIVYATVHDQFNNLVPNVTVTGTWSNRLGHGSCTTNNEGVCSIKRNKIKNNVSGVTLAVTNVVRTSYEYQASGNHDPDGDSNGTTITVSRP